MGLSNANIREAAFAGSFYPESKSSMLGMLHKFDRDSKDILADFYKSFDANGIYGLIVPHAGWVYSGRTAFMAYQLLKECKCQKIALLGPSHRALFHGVLADTHQFWRTPIGDCPIINDEFFRTERNVHANEHSLEVQIPFIHYFSPSSQVLPLVVGEISENLAMDYAKHLKDENYFIIISSDLSHYYPLGRARSIDAKTIEAIENAETHNLDACGRNPLKIAFAFMRKLNLKAHLINYSTSAEAFGDATSVVGYASFWF